MIRDPHSELIDLRQLKAFSALAETRSFTAAAEKLFITQSAVSHSIKALESSLDCKLFDRSGRSVSLTRQGRILLAHSGRIFREMQIALAELAETGPWGAGSVRVAATMTMCQYLLPAALREFQLSFPNCDIQIEPCDTGAALVRLEEGSVDFVAGLKLPQASRFACRPLFEDELAVLVAPSHPWATRARLSAADISAQRLIIYARSSYTFRLIEQRLEREGVHLRAPLEIGSMETIKELAKIGFGAGVAAPWIATREIAQGTLVCRKITSPPLPREWGLYWTRGKSLSLAEETFAGICETVAETFVESLPLETATGAVM